jgi:hypothetical protein
LYDYDSRPGLRGPLAFFFILFAFANYSRFAARDWVAACIAFRFFSASRYGPDMEYDVYGQTTTQYCEWKFDMHTTSL